MAGRNFSPAHFARGLGSRRRKKASAARTAWPPSGDPRLAFVPVAASWTQRKGACSPPPPPSALSHRVPTPASLSHAWAISLGGCVSPAREAWGDFQAYSVLALLWPWMKTLSPGQRADTCQENGIICIVLGWKEQDGWSLFSLLKLLGVEPLDWMPKSPFLAWVLARRFTSVFAKSVFVYIAWHETGYHRNPAVPQEYCSFFFFK